MPLTTHSSPFAGSSDLYNSGDPHHRVPIYDVLAHPAIASVSSRHKDRVKNVSRTQMDALLVANQAIDDTWHILNKGSGNQKKHLRSTEGDSFKRTMVLRAENAGNGGGWANIARTAARFEAGNCGEMAAVCALLCTSTGINQPVSILSSSIHDHAVAEIGDPRASDNTVIVDAWPEFGRAIRRKDFTLLGPQPSVEHTYLPHAAVPQERERLLFDHKATQKYIDSEFERLYPQMPKKSKVLVDNLLHTAPSYEQQHGAKNLRLRYQGEDSYGRPHQVDLNLSEAQFKQRLIQLGLNPKNGKSTPGNRRPHVSPIDTLKRALGVGRKRTQSVSAQPRAIAVAWTHPPLNRRREVEPPVIPGVTVPTPTRTRHRSMVAAQRPQTSRDDQRHAMDTPARRARADSLLTTRYRLPERYPGA